MTGSYSVEKKNCSWSYSLALRQFESQPSFPDELIPSIGITGKNLLPPNMHVLLVWSQNPVAATSAIWGGKQ